MDYQDVYYVDGRNATPVVMDHRGNTRLPSSTTVVSRGPAAGSFVPATATPMPYQYAQPSYGPAGYPSMAYPGAPQSWAGYSLYPPYVTAPPTNNLTSILGGFGDIGSLANIAAQVFAAFLPLPASPTPQDGEDQSTNASVNSSNLIRYQSALATFARRDQQILTLGSVIKELFKRPGVIG